MTTIDTTLYCNGELRLARHGAGKGGTVLVHVDTGEQIDVHPEAETAIIEGLNWYDDNGYAYPVVAFNNLREYHEGFMRSYSS